MAETAAHDEEMEDLVRSEIPVPVVKQGELHGIDDSPQGVDDAAGQKPEKSRLRQGLDDLGDGQNAHPAHGDVYEGGEPLGAGDPAGVDQDAHCGDSPHQGQQGPAGPVAQDDHADRGVGSGNEDEDHHVIDFPQQPVDLRRDVQGVIDGAGAVKPHHAEDKDGQGCDMHLPFAPPRLEKKGSGCGSSQQHGNKMGDGAAGILDSERPFF